MKGIDLIVVGVDGSAGGRRALRWAANEAVRSGAAVRAVNAWQHPGQSELASTANPTSPGERAELLLACEIGWLAPHERPVSLTTHTSHGDPATVLTEAAAGARLLVVGDHAHGWLHRILFGSVTDTCVRTAPCPVMVVPTPAAPAPTTSPVLVQNGGTRSWDSARSAA